MSHQCVGNFPVMGRTSSSVGSEVQGQLSPGEKGWYQLSTVLRFQHTLLLWAPSYHRSWRSTQTTAAAGLWTQIWT